MATMEAIQQYLHQQRPASVSSQSDDIDRNRVNELKAMVAKWSEFDEQAKKFSRLSRSYATLKKEYEAQILEVMREHEIEQLNTRGSMIQCVSKPRKKKVSRGRLVENVYNVIHDAETRRRVMEAIEADSTDTRVTLRRINLAQGSL